MVEKETCRGSNGSEGDRRSCHSSLQRKKNGIVQSSWGQVMNMESNARKERSLRTLIVLLGFLLGYGSGWAMMFPVMLLIFPVLLIVALYNIVGKLKPTHRKGVVLAAAALVISGLTVPKLGEYLLYRYARDGKPLSYQMPLWASAASASAPSIWEKSVFDKVERVKEGRSLFPSDTKTDEKGAGYSIGPDGSDQGGLIVYDPTNGVLSSGDIPLGRQRQSP